jgi:signal transduction histidine kinase
LRVVPKGRESLAASEALIEAGLRRARRTTALLRSVVAAAIVLPLGFLAAFAWMTYDVALTDAQTLVRRTVDVFHENTLKIFETQELILRQVTLLATMLPMQSIGRDLSDVLKELQEGRDQIAAIWIMDQLGEVRASSTSVTAGLNGADRDYFQAQRDGNIGTFVGKAFTGRVTGRSSFGFSRRLLSRDGSFTGIASISVSSDYFSEFFRRTAPEIGHVAFLIRDDGAPLARDPPVPNPPPFVAEDPLMRAIAAADSGVLWRVSQIDGIERLYGYRRVAGYPVIVTMAVPRSAIIEPWLRHLMFAALVTTAAMLALSIMTGVALRETRREEAALVRLLAEARHREEMEDRLRHAQKLEALGQMTGSVAHDFGNLLMPILANLQLLRGKLDDARAPARINDALAAAELGAKLVRSLLAFSRQQPLEFTSVDANAVIAGMAALLQHALTPRHRLALELAPRLWPTYADATQLQLAVLNLVINARDAMGEAGAVRISTENRTLAGEQNGLVGEFVAISVADTGAGMTPDILARAFEPFFTTKEKGTGTGLGLASVYGFTRQCGGSATIESAPGKGTTVTIYLPRMQS